MTLRPQTEHHLKFLSLKRGCTGSSESKLVKIPHCLKSHVTAHMVQEEMFFEESQDCCQSSNLELMEGTILTKISILVVLMLSIKYRFKSDVRFGMRCLKNFKMAVMHMAAILDTRRKKFSISICLYIHTI